MSGNGPGVVALVVVAYGFLVLLTAIGCHRRGNSLMVTTVSAVLFPLAWTGWYINDVLRPRRRI